MAVHDVAINLAVVRRRGKKNVSTYMASDIDPHGPSGPSPQVSVPIAVPAEITRYHTHRQPLESMGQLGPSRLAEAQARRDSSRH
jgi:hypothetical protein